MVGTPVTFSAATSDSTATVLWSFSSNAGATYNSLATSTTAFTGVTGATGNSLTLTPATVLETGYLIRATYTNTIGSTNTNAVTLIVTASTPTAPTVTTNPANASVVVGDNVSFFASASGVPQPTIQWQMAAAGSSTFANITDTRFTGAKTTTLSFTPALSDSGARFQAVFTNVVGTTSSPVTTTAATLTVSPATTPTPETPQGTNTQGVLVYDLKFKHLAGFGIDFFEDGYVVLPATGGTGEVVFLGRDHGKRIYSKQTGVKAFPAYTRDDKFTVVTMTGSSGASLSMHAYGKSDDKIKASTPTVSISVHGARTLHGLAQAALDESSSTTKAADGTSGFVEFAEMKLSLNEEETAKANDRSLSVTDAMKVLVTKVSARGYSELKLTTSTTTTDSSTNNSSTDSTTNNSSTTTTTTK